MVERDLSSPDSTLAFLEGSQVPVLAPDPSYFKLKRLSALSCSLLTTLHSPEATAQGQGLEKSGECLGWGGLGKARPPSRCTVISHGLSSPFLSVTALPLLHENPTHSDTSSNPAESFFPLLLSYPNFALSHSKLWLPKQAQLLNWLFISEPR